MAKTEKEHNQLYYARHKQKENERCNKYHWANRDKIKKRKDIYNHFYWNDISFGGNRFNALYRDNWECQKCGMTNEQHILVFSKSIHVHHIDGSGKTNNPNHNINNLITLCVRCHASEDAKLRRNK